MRAGFRETKRGGRRRRARRWRLRRPYPALVGLIGLNCAVELVLAAADAGLIGGPHWRQLAYQNGAFWAGLLADWRPNYAAQPWLMFVTYAELHSGIGHLAGNMLALLGLGTIVIDRLGQGRFLAVYALSAIGGGIGFGLLGPAVHPMVGASGALFGLAGAWTYWDWAARRARGRSRWPVVWTILTLAALNFGLWVALSGLLAWETHLGGFLAGWAAAAAVTPRGGPRGSRRGDHVASTDRDGGNEGLRRVAC